MPLSWDNIQANALAFSKRWKDSSNEQAEAQHFVVGLLNVFGVDDPVRLGDFEYRVVISDTKTGRIDYLWKSKIAVEMKSRGKNLNEAYEQLQTYMETLDEDEIPDLLMVSDFEDIRLFRRSTDETHSFKTKDLHKHVKRFASIAGYSTERIRKDQLELNIKAAEKMAKLHDTLKSHGYEGNDLEVYLVRLLFCMFAGDTGIFPKGNFYHYINDSKADGSDLSHRIADLFEVLNMPDDVRNKRTLLSDELRQFRYINGELFKERLPPADFDDKTRKILLECREFDWSQISPAIFGAMFQGVMDKEKRRELGAHYTSEENILKLINPLFLDDLYKEFEKVKTDPIGLDRFHDKISKLKFLDPACGCGNFLIITYRELRLLELEILKMKIHTDQMSMDISPLLKVGVEQFYGIEYEAFPCHIAQVGLWLTDHQMNLKASEFFGTYYIRLPLTHSATIVHANALRIDWNDVVSKPELSYILGNPPFVWYGNQSKEQKEDMTLIFPKNKNLDYVCAWYKKATEFMKDTSVKAAFVSTNSIVQGEQPTVLWKPLVEKGIFINFGIPTFKWGNDAKGQATVHCVIIGFSYCKSSPIINQYLLEAPLVFINKRSKPICKVPEMSKGNIPVDGGYLIIEAEEYNGFIEKEPEAKQFIRRFLGTEEYLNNLLRYCLWLENVSPSLIRNMPFVLERIEGVRKTRLKSSKEATRKFADFPTRFMENRQPTSDYIAIPEISSEKRKYIPMGFLTPDIISSSRMKIVPNATLFHFGILSSNVHMAWMRAICGRLEMRYIYSNTIVYNNFPWIDATEEQQQEIGNLAKLIIDARALFPDSSLADLYDPLTMPPELLKAHQNLDRAVLQLYGFPTKKSEFNEADCVAALMERYQKLINDEK